MYGRMLTQATHNLFKNYINFLENNKHSREIIFPSQKDLTFVFAKKNRSKSVSLLIYANI